MPEPLNDEHWRLLRCHISGIDRTAQLYEAGRIEQARDHLISCARACWTNRWLSVRRYTLARLGAALDTGRCPDLAAVAAALMDGEPGAAGRFLDSLRDRKEPDASPFTVGPSTPPEGFDPETASSFALWQASTATGDARLKERLDRRIGEFLDPAHVIGWHETNRPWALLVMSALRHGGIDDETLCKLILFGLDCAEHCNVVSHLSEPAQPSIGGNHIFNHIAGWLTFTALFPEFRRSPALQHAAVARLDDEVSKQVMPDGSMIEGAPGYQNCCIYGASEFLRICRQMRIELPARVCRAWEQMLRFAIGIMKPDGRVPMFGDSQDDVVWSLSHAMADFYDFPEYRWVHSRGAEGHPPEFRSVAFPCIGYYVQRSGWGKDACYLCFDGGRFGQAHHHEDKLNFELCAFGRAFIVDVGVHSYSDHWFRQWAVTSAGHNVVLADGAGQCRWREDRDRWYSSVPLKNRWQPGEDWDVIEADFDGPWEREIGQVRVRRRIAFHRREPMLWWVTDWCEGERRHETTELFHFAHDVEVIEAVDGGVRTRIPGGPDLALLCLSVGVGVDLYRGEQDPPRGWVSPARNELAPAWEVHFTGCGEAPMRRDFVLLPWPEALPDECHARLCVTGALPTLRIAVGGAQHDVALPEP